MEKDNIDKIINDANSTIKQSNNLLNELKFMNEQIELLKKEYLTNKRYFCSEGSRPTINDVIRTVYEFAWASRGNYDYNKAKMTKD